MRIVALSTVATIALMVVACGDNESRSAATTLFVVETAVPDSEATRTATWTPTVTPVPTATATRTAEERELAALARVPEHMVYAWWDWDYENPNRNYESGMTQITVDVEIHNSVELVGRNGIYLMVCSGDVDGTGYYFGLQTDVHEPGVGGRGKGLLFSRWNERDLEHARPALDGWTESSGHEGDFIGVRRSYEWDAGEYQMRIGPDGADEAGQWYGVWIVEQSSGEETWAGSLRFPYVGGRALLGPRCYNTVEVYGGPMAPENIPYWKVTLGPPMGDGEPAVLTDVGRSSIYGGFRNSRLWFDDEGAVVYEVGLDHIVHD